MINLSYFELQYLISIIEESGDNSSKAEDLHAKLVSAQNDLWKPLRQLPPLNVIVVLKNLDGDMIFAKRVSLADSYSPDSLKMKMDHTPLSVDGAEELELDTSKYMWRLR